jgi:hypothetical protein
MVPTSFQEFRLCSEASNSTINGPFMRTSFTSIETYYVKLARYKLKFPHSCHVRNNFNTHKAVHMELLGRFMINLHTKIYRPSFIRLLHHRQSEC